MPFAEAHPVVRGLGIDAVGDVFVLYAASQEAFVVDRSNRLVHRLSVSSPANGTGGTWQMGGSRSGDVFTLAFATGMSRDTAPMGASSPGWTVPNGGGPIGYDPRGSLLVQAGNDLLRYSPDGELVANLGGGFSPSNITVNNGGNRWLMMNRPPLLVDYNAAGSMTTWLQRGYRAPAARFLAPARVATGTPHARVPRTQR